VRGEGVATAAALCPLACWDLLARTHVIGMILAAVLAVGAGFGLALAFGLLRPGARGGLLLAYVPVTTSSFASAYCSNAVSSPSSLAS